MIELGWLSAGWTQSSWTGSRAEMALGWLDAIE
jgi:hypothetical protein